MISLPIVDSPKADEPKRLWRSEAHLHQEPDFVESNSEEFLPGASNPLNGSRRHFMQLLGASMALGGLAACRRPVEHIMPFSDRPEELIPGIPLHYATAMPLRGSVQPLLVKSNDGRPTKIEGNAQHPGGTGATGVFEQASLLNLYDPDRSHTILRNGTEASWDDFLNLCQRLQVGSRRVAVLAAPTSSPTTARLRSELEARFPLTNWLEYRPEGVDQEALGIESAFGAPYRPVYHFDRADVIVSLDADFLGPAAQNTRHNTLSFAKSRRLHEEKDTMSRLYVAESTYTSTGLMADHRRRMTSADISQLALDLAAALGLRSGESPSTFANELAAELQSAQGSSIVLAGESQPAEVHALCAVINQHLGAIGQTVEFLDTGAAATTRPEDFASLVNDMLNGRVDVLLMLGVNPIYDAPANLSFANALERVSDSIHVGLHVDESAQASTWHLPAAHYLESWGDGRTWDGTLTPIQPLIAPLYEDARSHNEVLGALTTGSFTRSYDQVRTTWQPVLEADSFESAWRRVLHDGYLADTEFDSITPEAATFAGTIPASPGGLELVLRLDPTVLDGSFANNAWCQELPDPITKIVWDNVAVMSPATAQELDVASTYRKGRYYADVVTLSANGQSISLPVWVLPGHPDHSITVNLGYGRSIATTRPHRNTPFWDTDDKTDVYAKGTLATGVGANAFLLRDALARPVASGLQVTKTGQTAMVVTTQDHGVLDVEARPLVRMATLSDYQDNPSFALEHEVPTPGSDTKTRFEDYPTLWEDHHPKDSEAFRDSDYWQNQWGMVIDLNTCTGCNACVVACQAENNVQVVGKDEVANGRELHWLRIDRYFLSEDGLEVDDDPQMVVQPMPCQHCENAPCESVCPVAATVHSPDGTNQMIYNRCIGTRYCANNCPYKVRRFNYYNWSKTIPETVQMAQNPDVSIRFRGVMEKCSFCVQRIRSAQKNAGLEKRALHRDEVVTACQQACPAEAITFGDLNDPASQVSLARTNPRMYTMLAELNIRPRVSYLARVSNPRVDHNETA